MNKDIPSFGGVTTVDEPCEGLLEKAKAWSMGRCLVLGWNEDGELVFGGSFSDVAEINLLLDLAKAGNLEHATSGQGE